MNEPTTPDFGLLLQWLFGGFVVLIYAHDRFTKPRSMRATTTFWRYWSAWCGYIVAMLALFVVLGGGITELDPRVLLPLLGSDKGVPESTSPGPLLSALLLTSLLPHFPLLGKIDEAVKEWFQRVGNIPYEVRELSGFLRAASYEPQSGAADRLAVAFRSYGVDPSWLHETSDTIRRRWARSVALYAQIQNWEDARGYARYVDENRPALAAIRTQLEALAEIVDTRTLSELDRESDSLLVAHMRRKIGGDIMALQRAQFDFVSGGVLSGGRNYIQRHAALTEMGFSGLPAAHGPLSAHDIVLVMGLVFLAMLFIPLMMRRFFDPTPLATNLRILVMVPIIYAIAIVAAVYPKSVWPFARRESAANRPVAAYALSGVLAALAAFAVSLLFRFAFDTPGNVFQALSTPGAFRNAWEASLDRWPWQLMTLLVTVVIAWTTDDYLPDAATAPGWLRWTETGALAVIFSALQWMVLQLLAMTLPPAIADSMMNSMPRMLLTAAVVGGCIGWFVPHLYRSRSNQRTGPVVAGAVKQTA
jgi:hypothetical protein